MRWLALMLLLAGCATARPCEIIDGDTRRAVEIGMECVCTGTPIESMACRRVE